jgi:hypothetical protein
VRFHVRFDGGKTKIESNSSRTPNRSYTKSEIHQIASAICRHIAHKIAHKIASLRFPVQIGIQFAENRMAIRIYVQS